MPSGLGGDVIRVLQLRLCCGRSRATASVLLDRVAGVSFNLALVMTLLPAYYWLAIPDAAKIGFACLSIGPRGGGDRGADVVRLFLFGVAVLLTSLPGLSVWVFTLSGQAPDPA